jgi:hypothetical protein
MLADVCLREFLRDASRILREHQHTGAEVTASFMSCVTKMIVAPVTLCTRLQLIPELSLGDRV